MCKLNIVISIVLGATAVGNVTSQIPPHFAVSSPRQFHESVYPNLPYCCAKGYDSPKFFILSPGFPYYRSEQEDCVYQIYRANEDTCRMRLHFKFLWVHDNSSNYGCQEAFLEIDGKRICGCQYDLKLISPFDSRWRYTPKVIRYRHNKSLNKLRGFVIEIIQDECPRRIVPERESTKSINYEINRAIFLNDSKSNSLDGAIRSVYFFDYPQEKSHEIEQTLYIDTYELNSIVSLGLDYSYCQNWGSFQWKQISSEIPQNYLFHCTGTNSETINRQFVLANYVRGYIQSPGYPYGYRGTLNLSYRIVKQANYCTVRVHFDDFHLDNTDNCEKDRLTLLGRYRYCGQSLLQSTLTFDLTNKLYEDLYFITRGQSCGRGFRATYQQIPCTSFPTNPPFPITNPTTPCYHTITSTSPQPPCIKSVKEITFVFELYANDNSNCVFNIQKNRSEVCQILLTIDYANLDCKVEALVIENRRYCGRIDGYTTRINFEDYRMSLIYERSTEKPLKTGLIFRLSGTQMTDGCEPYEFPDVPAQRILKSKNNTKNDHVATDKNEICGIIINATRSDDSEIRSICDTLNEKNNVTNKCVDIQPEMLYIPYRSDAFVRDNISHKKLYQKYAQESQSYEISCKDLRNIVDLKEN